MNLIVTPVYKNFEVLKQCCQAIDNYSNLPYLHILVDDNSGEELPIEVKENRRILYVKSDIPTLPHINQGGQMIQLGIDYGRQMYWNGKPKEQIEEIFMIESDVVVKLGWDSRMIDFTKKLPVDWGTLDCRSVDENGQTTYPDTVVKNLGELDGLRCWIREYPQFQCTLFNKNILDRGIKISDSPSHFDIMFGRKTTELLGIKHYESMDITVHHINGGGNSRDLLPK